jgi:predicted membrane protein
MRHAGVTVAGKEISRTLIMLYALAKTMQKMYNPGRLAFRLKARRVNQRAVMGWYHFILWF